jgi:hypothetical protein
MQKGKKMLDFGSNKYIRRVSNNESLSSLVKKLRSVKIKGFFRISNVKSWRTKSSQKRRFMASENTSRYVQLWFEKSMLHFFEVVDLPGDDADGQGDEGGEQGGQGHRQVGVARRHSRH